VLQRDDGLSDLDEGIIPRRNKGDVITQVVIDQLGELLLHDGHVVLDQVPGFKEVVRVDCAVLAGALPLVAVPDQQNPVFVDVRRLD